MQHGENRKVLVMETRLSQFVTQLCTVHPGVLQSSSVGRPVPRPSVLHHLSLIHRPAHAPTVWLLWVYNPGGRRCIDSLGLPSLDLLRMVGMIWARFGEVVAFEPVDHLAEQGLVDLARLARVGAASLEVLSILGLGEERSFDVYVHVVLVEG